MPSTGGPAHQVPPAKAHLPETVTAQAWPAGGSRSSPADATGGCGRIAPRPQGGVRPPGCGRGATRGALSVGAPEHGAVVMDVVSRGPAASAGELVPAVVAVDAGALGVARDSHTAAVGRTAGDRVVGAGAGATRSAAPEGPLAPASPGSSSRHGLGKRPALWGSGHGPDNCAACRQNRYGSLPNGLAAHQIPLSVDTVEIYGLARIARSRLPDTRPG